MPPCAPDMIIAAQRTGGIRAGDPGQLDHAMIGIVTMGFIHAQEYVLMTGHDRLTDRHVAELTALTFDFLGFA